MRAYDLVNWDFLTHLLSCFGLPAKFINWTRECITSSRFFIALNGSLAGYCEGRKGLRQGDSLSPYLFVLAMEVFSKHMEEYVVKRADFKFHYRCSKMRLTHLYFADDLLIF
jgi:hypothetical protein